ncbi:MAG: hypothetical protein CM15mP49_20330 [Actinomycetota bacterium]|nr:MAG: hypothetical protein CM15mP49_20330 [Actinomycetota bacterium]
MKELLQSKEAEYSSAADTLNNLAIALPNPASERCPDGGEEDYEVIDITGDCNQAPPMTHSEYGSSWTGLKQKGCGEYGQQVCVPKNEAVLLEFALIQYVMSKLVGKGFTPVVTPVLVREEMMIDAGFFPYRSKSSL